MATEDELVGNPMVAKEVELTEADDDDNRSLVQSKKQDATTPAMSSSLFLQNTEKNPGRVTYGLVALSLGLLVWAITTTALLGKSKNSSNSKKKTVVASSSEEEWAALPSTVARVGFGSCAEQANPQPYWDTVVGQELDLLILGGDNVYGDCESEGCPELGLAYAELAAKPSFRGAKSQVPMAAVWDDHDFGKNDGDASFEQKDLAKAKFLEFFDVGDERADPGRGLYKDFRFFFPPSGGGGGGGETAGGDSVVQLLLLDTRWDRSPFEETDEPGAPYKERYVASDDASRTMLGDGQWRWLEDRLAEPARLRLVVSTIQVVADGHGWECWRMLLPERRRLYDVLKARNGGTAFLLTGDRHVGGFYKYTYDDGEALYEATASSWTHTCPTCDEPGPNRLGDLVTFNHFAQLDIDSRTNTLNVTLRKAHATDGSGFDTDAADVIQALTIDI